jgi:hypothetical protein
LTSPVSKFLNDELCMTMGGSPTLWFLVPCSYTTTLRGINDWGSIVGIYFDAFVNPDRGPPRTEERVNGFMYEGGQFTTLNVPGSTRTYLTGINNRGHIVGYYYDPGGTRVPCHSDETVSVSRTQDDGPEPLAAAPPSGPVLTQVASLSAPASHSSCEGSLKVLVEGKPNTTCALHVAISELAYSALCDMFGGSRIGEVPGLGDLA